MARALLWPAALALLLPALAPLASARRTRAREPDDMEPEHAPLLHFYIYRAGQKEWPSKVSDWERSQNFANAGGVMRYIQNEVVGVKVVGSAKPPKCERKYNIDRIYRYKVAMRSTVEAVTRDASGFLGFVAIDQAKCTVPDCDDLWWSRFGYVPGCQDQDLSGGYPDAIWYSFPGRCPGRDRTQKCREDVEELEDPGGACRPALTESGELTAPNGNWTCTYVYQPAGEITLDELVGIKEQFGSYKEFCEQGGVEFNGPGYDDTGVTLDFWKEYTNVERNKERTGAMLRLFQKKYPEMPLLDDPECSKPFVRPSYWPADLPSPTPSPATPAPKPTPSPSSKNAARGSSVAAALTPLALLSALRL